MSYNANSDWDDVYADIIGECGRIFIDKMADYGPTWLYFRDVSLVDQLWIKIKRVRTLEKNGGKNAVGEGSEGEFIAIIKLRRDNADEKALSRDIPHGGYYIDNPDEAAALPSDEMRGCSARCARGLRFVQTQNQITARRGWKCTRIRSPIRYYTGAAHKRASLPTRAVRSEGMEAQLMEIINYSIFAYKTRGIDAAEG